MSNHPSKVLKITNLRGLHARASAKFVQCAESYDAEVTVSKDGHMVGGTSIMGLMMLAASKGSQIHLVATGNEADEVLNALSELIEAKFGEDE